MSVRELAAKDFDDITDLVEAVINGRDRSWIALLKEHGILMEAIPNGMDKSLRDVPAPDQASERDRTSETLPEVQDGAGSSPSA